MVRERDRERERLTTLLCVCVCVSVLILACIFGSCRRESGRAGESDKNRLSELSNYVGNLSASRKFSQTFCAYKFITYFTLCMYFCMLAQFCRQRGALNYVQFLAMTETHAILFCAHKNQ